MATGPPPPASSTNTGKNRTLITITALVGIVVVVVLLALYSKHHGPRQRLEDLHLENELRRSAYRQRRKEQQHGGITPTLLQFIPAVKYSGSSTGERQTKSLDLEKRHAEGAIQTRSLVQGQLNIKALQVETSEEQNQLNIKAIQVETREEQMALERDDRGGTCERLQSGFEEQECPICTQPFVPDEDVRVLPCRHIHHKSCIDPWLLGFSGTCPVCRVHMDTFQLSSAEKLDLPQKPPPVVVTGANFEHRYRPRADP
ncbi:hypothetical protein PV04_09217 [Phialophora macrospora]|uniref:RING-type domain-containing protein n=1 Tax=Phialophora macrospora TaxID=1851006 RepID=A0A0D2FBL4_9EURO|nr:hypothetical protein PV04_09217 [Phialophora macrospora]